MESIVSANADILSFVNAAPELTDGEIDGIIRAALAGGQSPAQLPAARAGGVRYKASRFNCRVETRSGHIVFNSLYGSLCRLDDGDIGAVERGEPCGEIAEYGFVVDERADELGLYLRATGISRAIGPGKANVVVAPTTECNARCAYCFEAGARRERMTEGTALATADWISALPNADRGVSITWFGGEPLMHTKALDTISRRLTENGTKFRSYMITNGTLLEEIDATAFERWGLTELQVTLDGGPREYARRKNFADGGGADRYFALINSIAGISDGDTGAAIHIRLNIDRDNMEEIVGIARDLDAMFGSRERVSWYPAFIAGTPRSVPREGKIVVMSEIFRSTRDIRRTSGFKSLFGMPKFSPCHYCDKNAFAVDASGRVYICEHHVGQPGLAAGTVFEPFGDLRNERAQPPEHEMCRSCSWLPRCGGGCRGNFDAGDEPCFEARYAVEAYMNLL